MWTVPHDSALAIDPETSSIEKTPTLPLKPPTKSLIPSRLVCASSATQNSRSTAGSEPPVWGEKKDSPTSFKEAVHPLVKTRSQPSPPVPPPPSETR